jgi:hypothetical protein
MLSVNDLSNVQNLIDDETITFDELITKFTTNFDNSKYFKICMTLEILIKDHQLNLFQEIVAFYILYYLNKEEKGYSNFTSLVLKILKETKNKEKKIILLNLMEDKITNTQIKIIDYIKMIENIKIDKNIDKEINNIINEGYTHENNNKDLYLINPTVSEKKLSDNILIKQNDIQKYSSDKNNLKYIEPNYMLLYYPINSKQFIFKDELIFILPYLKHNFIWENNCFDKIRYLINQILDNGSITNDEIDYIISSIKKKPNIIKNINLTPQQMMELIEKDESLSFEILAIICKTSLNE